MTDRIKVERASVELLRDAAERMLSRPKNRAKGIPTETVVQLVRMAQDELDEVLEAVRNERGTDAVRAELGDAAAVVALALWRFSMDQSA